LLPFEGGRVDEWRSLDRFRLANLLLSTFSVGAGAFASLLLFHTFLFDAAVRISCILMIAILVIASAINRKLINLMPETERTYAMSAKTLIRVLYATYFLGFIGLLAGAVNVAPDYNFTFLLFGLYTLLIASAAQFVRSVFYGGSATEGNV